MADLLARVQAALGERYDVLSQIGRGGMATVFLASDPRHRRQVAIKVLDPELSAYIGSDRFLREIEIAAGLSHPHILPLYDSGDAGGLLYFVMPFIEGESLRHRLDRETLIPIDDALQLIRDVAAGLAHAHSRGIVHRDIKPENILLSGREALIADFGIARAIGAANQSRLTQTGMAIGTPSYMSPEQALGEGDVDGRSDLYSLACVLYEMLAGKPPFAGSTIISVLGRHSREESPSLHALRPKVPAQVDLAIQRALEKTPADRYATVTQFAEALTQPTSGVTAWLPRRRSTLRRMRTWAGTLLVLAGAILGGWFFRGAARTSGVRPLDPSAVAVLPFAVTGTLDTSLVSPEGIVELLYTRLSGEGGSLRALYPASVERAWRRTGTRKEEELSPESAVRLAQGLGAGQVLLGRVFGDRGRVTLTASLLAVPTGNEISRVEVPGPSDSLLSLLDQMAAKILISSTGGNQRNLYDLTTGKLSALRPYLAGLQKYRRGQYRDAANDFTRALEEDSTFALAGLALGTAENLADGDPAQGWAVAWAQRDRLSATDRKFLTAWLGPRYPIEPTIGESFAIWEELVDSVPDRWEASYQLGEMLFHYGELLGKPASRQRAATAFRRSLEGDSAFAPALEHLVDLAAMSGDTAEARRFGRLYLSADSMGDNADYVRWRLSVALGDSVLHTRVMSRIDSLSSDLLARLAGTAQLDGVALDDAALAIRALQDQARNQGEFFRSSVLARQFFLNKGQPRAAADTRADQPRGLPFDPFFQIVEALYWDGDTTAAALTVRRIAAGSELSPSARNTADMAHFINLCTLGVWRSARGEWVGIDGLIRKLRAVGAGVTLPPVFLPLCADLLEADLARHEGRPGDQTRAIAIIDSVVVSGPAVTSYILLVANLTSARLHEANGNPAAALAAIRHRVHLYERISGLSTLLREEGRLATLVGDTAGAIRAYRHYLVLRSEPDPALDKQAREVRAALTRLEASGS
jgi:tetratricopeptide (TPR) repeat protein